MFYFCRARYEDAKFFYEVDTRKRFSEFRDQLQGILFHVSFPSVHILDKKLDMINALLDGRTSFVFSSSFIVVSVVQ